MNKEVKIIEVLCYQTSDGLIFDTIEKAEKHQAKLDFKEWYEKNELIGVRYGSKIEAEVFIDYCKEHSERLAIFLLSLNEKL